MKPWMFNCERVSEKISESLDLRLPFRHRLMIRLHVLMCIHCANLRRQLIQISKAIRYDDSSLKDEPKLSKQARERISRSLKYQHRGNSEKYD
jgi:hypothetical protein